MFEIITIKEAAREALKSKVRKNPDISDKELTEEITEELIRRFYPDNELLEIIENYVREIASINSRSKKKSDKAGYCMRCGKYVSELRLLFRKHDFVERNQVLDKIINEVALAGEQEVIKVHGSKLVEQAMRYEGYIDRLVKSNECQECAKEDGCFKLKKL